MPNWLKSLSKFKLLLFLVMVVTGGIHFAVKNQMGTVQFPYFITCYFVNYAVTAAGFALLLWAEAKQKMAMGYVFFASSTLKFIVYFIVISPMVTEGKAQFLTFFIPYAVALILEVQQTIKRLNNQP